MVLQALVTDVPTGWLITDVYMGSHWVVALVRNDSGAVRAGVAAAYQQAEHCHVNRPADVVVRGLLSTDMTEAAIGLATLNAINQPDHLTNSDAADWLAMRCTGRNMAIFGRFPFIEDELRPGARQVWVFEQEPQAGEYDSTAIPDLVPQADVVAITGSSIINHSLDTILPHVRLGSTVVLLGPSTPLSEKLFDFGINALFGVRIANIQQVIDSVGSGFQKMQGTERVALLNKTSHPSP